MKIPYSWLKDYVDINLPAGKLAELLTMAGLEVTSLHKYDDDFVFEIEVTSNRPDCLSVIGLAREVAAIIGARCENRQSATLRTRPLPLPLILHPFNISIADKNACPLYIARLIKDVKIAQSPPWLIKRLSGCGIRSVNNIVDITNYVCLEYGQPLHAFDYEKIEGGRIVIRYAARGEKIATIDNIEHILEGPELVISDISKPLAIAGIMGGKNSEVGQGTKDILLESAYFDPLTVRRASKRLKLSSESSYRFERGVMPDMVEIASKRAASLILQLAGGRLIIFGRKDYLSKARKKTVVLKPDKVNRILGLAIPATAIKQILKRLGFKPLVCSSSSTALQVSIPSFRRDIRCQIDLIEEIGRIYGYNNLPAGLSVASFNFIPEPSLQWLARTTRQTLAGLGLNEAITYSILASQHLARLFKCDNSGLLKLSNPLSLEQDALRPWIFPGLVYAISYNLNRQIERPCFFEIGKVFSPNSSCAEESMHLAIAASDTDFFYIKGAIEALFCVLRVNGYSFEKTQEPYLAPGDCASINVQGKHVGSAGRLSKDIIKALDISKDVYICELCLNSLVKYAIFERRFIRPPKYPAQFRDISIEVDSGISHQQIMSIIKEAGAHLVKDIRLFDYYKGHQITQGKKGLTYSIEYRSPERTLRDGEVDEVHSRIQKEFAEKLKAKIR